MGQELCELSAHDLGRGFRIKRLTMTSTFFSGALLPLEHATASPGSLVIGRVDFVHDIIEHITAFCDARHQNAERGVVDVLHGMQHMWNMDRAWISAM